MKSDSEGADAHGGEQTAERSPLDGPPRRYEVARNVLGRKWHLQIIHQLLAADSLRFSGLQERVGASSKMLSESLSHLEDAGVVERTVVQDKPPEVEYSLTSAGRDLEGVVQAALQWATAHGEAVDD